MSSPPSKKKLSSRRPPSKALQLRGLEADEVSRLEHIHGLLIDAYVFVSVAAELERDKRWGDRMTVLVPCASKRLFEADERIRELVDLVYRRLRRDSRKTR